jgi:hypothetical protein
MTTMTAGKSEEAMLSYVLHTESVNLDTGYLNSLSNLY